MRLALELAVYNTHKTLTRDVEESGTFLRWGHFGGGGGHHVVMTSCPVGTIPPHG